MPRFRQLFSCLLMLCASIAAQAQMKWNQQCQTYIDQYKDLAIEQMLKYRIPASITLDQGLFAVPYTQLTLPTTLRGYISSMTGLIKKQQNNVAATHTTRITV